MLEVQFGHTMRQALVYGARPQALSNHPAGTKGPRRVHRHHIPALRVVLASATPQPAAVPHFRRENVPDPAVIESRAITIGPAGVKDEFLLGGVASPICHYGILTILAV